MLINRRENKCFTSQPREENITNIHVTSINIVTEVRHMTGTLCGELLPLQGTQAGVSFLVLF